jgi:carbon-monoxide dehydrogenase small subunit
MLIAAEALLREKDAPTREEIDHAIGGNICRCTGYVQIREAIELAAARRTTGQAIELPIEPEAAHHG